MLDLHKDTNNVRRRQYAEYLMGTHAINKEAPVPDYEEQERHNRDNYICRRIDADHSVLCSN